LVGATLQFFDAFITRCDVSCNDVAENSELISGATDDSNNNDARVRLGSSSILNESNVPVGSDDTERDDVRESSVALEGYNMERVSGGSGEELDVNFCSASRHVDDMLRLH